MKSKKSLLFLFAALLLPSFLSAAVSICPPAGGSSTDCDFIVTIHPGGTATIATVQGATGYSSGGNVGSLVGIVNGSGAPFTGTVTLQGSFSNSVSDGIFDFGNSDGICNILTTATYCAGAATGYEGPRTTFSNVLTYQNPYDTATVNILNLARGGTTYFSIEGTPNTISGTGGLTLLGAGSGPGPKCPIIPGSTNTDCAFILTIGATGTATITPVANANPYDSTRGNGTLVGVVNNSGGVFTGSFKLQGTFPTIVFPAGIFDFHALSVGAPANALDGICNYATSPSCGTAATGYEGPLIAFSAISGGDCSTCGNVGTVNISNLSPNATTYFSLQGTPAGITTNGGITVVSGGPSAGSGTVCPQGSPATGVNQNCGYLITIGPTGAVSVGAGSEGNTLSDTGTVVGVVNNSGAPFSGSFSLTGRSGFNGIFQFSDVEGNGICSTVFAPYCATSGAYEGPLVTYSGVANTSEGVCTSCTGVVTVNNVPSGGSTYFSLTLTPMEIDATGGLMASLLSANVAVPPTTLPDGVVGTAYSQPLTAINGTSPYSWSLAGGSLPGGLSLSSGGVLSGTPTAEGTFSFSATALDSMGGMATGNITVTIAPFGTPTGPTLTISGNASLPTIALGGSLSGRLTASGGTPPYSWTSSALPPGVGFGGGTIGGVPAQPGLFSFTVTLQDSVGGTTSAVVSYSVFGITTASLPNGITSAYYSQSISTTGSSAFPISYSAQGVPPGLTLNGSGLLSGIPSAQGTYTLRVQATDANGLVSKVSLPLTVTVPPPITVPAATLSPGTIGTHYSQSVGAMGGAPPYTWTVAGGTPPPGLILGAQGVVSGTPTALGTFTFSARATDVTGGSSTGTITIMIAATPLTLSVPALPAGFAGVNYPMQLLSGSGGVAPYTYALAKGSSLPAGLSLSSAGVITGTPTGAGNTTFTVNITDSGNSTANASLQITVRPSAPDLFLSAGGLSFSSVTGSNATPPAQSVQVQSTVIGTVLSYSVAVAGGTPWLSASPAGGTTPGALSVSLTNQALSLAASSTPYTANIAVTCTAPSPCAGNSQNIAVSLSVTAAPPQLTVLNELLAFTASVAAPQPSTLTLNVQNTGSGGVGIASVTPGAGWLKVAGVPGSVSPGPTVPLTVTADPTSLAAGFYRTTITIISSAGTFVTPVSLFVASSPSMAVEPGGVQFQVVAGGAPGNVNNSFLVDVSSTTAVNWKAAVQPGASWLLVSTPTGSSTATQPGTVTFTIDPAASAALAAGTYYGLIRVTAAGVVNSPLDFEVVLNILPAGSPQTPAPAPQGLLFITSNALAPPMQNVQLYSNGPGPLGYQASATTTDGNKWLSVSPTTGTATPAGTVSQVTVNAAGLAPGIYYGGVNYAFGSAGVRTIKVALVLEPIPPGASVSAQVTPKASSSCTANLMAAAQVGLVNNFSAPTAWPTPLAIQLVNNCGDAIPNGQIVTTFSNGDPPMALALANSSTGLYAGTWTPRHSASQVTITAKATAPGLAPTSDVLTGAVTPNSAPILTPESTLHIFNPQVGAGLGPGTIVQLYGSNLAAQTTIAPSVPLATSLNGTSVIIGGITTPLFFVSAGQINAQIPFELTAGQQYQVIVSANGALTTPDTIQLTPISPGIAALASGAAIAQHADGSLVTEIFPAKPGENLVIYTAGLGDTDNPVTTGGGAPVNPLARPLTMPTLTVGGENATILFAGLTPGLVGLYQVNFTLPADAKNGDLALLLSQNGELANTTVLPVHN